MNSQADAKRSKVAPMVSETDPLVSLGPVTELTRHNGHGSTDDHGSHDGYKLKD